MYVETVHSAPICAVKQIKKTVPLVLSLLDQVYLLRRQLNALTSAIQCQPEDTRGAILDLLDEPRRPGGSLG